MTVVVSRVMVSWNRPVVHSHPRREDKTMISRVKVSWNGQLCTHMLYERTETVVSRVKNGKNRSVLRSRE